MNKKILGIGLVFLFMVSVITPVTLGYNIRISNKKDIQSTSSGNGPMDSAWPMYSHDVRHTGRSPYSTAIDLGYIRWEYFYPELSSPRAPVQGGIAIADDGTIYHCSDDDLFAFDSNGIYKWSYNIHGWIKGSCPAIADDGTIYFGTGNYFNSYLYAINPDGTEKWGYDIGYDDIYSSPIIGNDGTIYIGIDRSCTGCGGAIRALTPNCTVKWEFWVTGPFYSSPSIGEDGTIYCGSDNYYIYALYPNNGKIKWYYQTGCSIRTSPCIGDDGTIYVVSYDSYIYAFNPDGSIKWMTNVSNAGAGISPVIGQDGTIYCGYTKLLAINPVDGSIKWEFNDFSGFIHGATPCISADGTIYFGTHITDYSLGEIIALNSDGILKWRKWIGGCETPPAIGEDGTVYISAIMIDTAYLYAFGDNPVTYPSQPDIKGYTDCEPGISYAYRFKSIDPNGDDVKFLIEWGDGSSEETRYIQSGKTMIMWHSWSERRDYAIEARAMDTDGQVGNWNILRVTISKDKAVNFNSLSLKFLEKFPFLQKLLNQINFR
jgi:outer membrane protein assembly factor BamB